MGYGVDMTCSRCGVDIEEAAGAIAKKKAWKAERKTLRADNEKLTAALSAQSAQLKALQAEVAVLRTPSTGGAAGGAPSAKEETIAVPIGRRGKRIIQMSPAQARVIGNMR
jgi:hypothetical protein